MPIEVCVEEFSRSVFDRILAQPGRWDPLLCLAYVTGVSEQMLRVDLCGEELFFDRSTGLCGGFVNLRIAQNELARIEAELTNR